MFNSKKENSYNKKKLEHDQINNKKLVNILNKKIFKGFIKTKKLNELKNKNSPLILNNIYPNNKWNLHEPLPFEDIYNITYEKTFLKNDDNDFLNKNININLKINKVDAKKIIDNPLIEDNNNYGIKLCRKYKKIEIINASTQTISNFKKINFEPKINSNYIHKKFHKIISYKSNKEFETIFSNIHINNKMNLYKNENNKIKKIIEPNYHSYDNTIEEHNNFKLNNKIFNNNCLKKIDENYYLNNDKLYFSYLNNQNNFNISTNKTINYLKKKNNNLFNKKINLKNTPYDTLTKEFNRKKKQFENNHKLFFNERYNLKNNFNNDNNHYLKTEISYKNDKKILL
jgi:hypothetical protein